MLTQVLRRNKENISLFGVLRLQQIEFFVFVAISYTVSTGCS